ncbi:uncharacterized protein LOC131218158 [Magnolia sinica]|uniref:uncharacterized protein LOC131218158 n=1 Tax=Magnolia sinica TaxID=86752 RepID=UPI002658D5B1|nr:uncharacterized protein LOC131218158 [Magnolia sinica]
MIRESKRPVVAAKLGFDNQISEEPVDNKIWVLAKGNIQIQIIRAARQYIILRVSEESLTHPLFILAVYASCFKDLRMALWDELRNTSCSMVGPWVVCGHFNTTTSPDERLGGPLQMTTVMTGFHEAISDSGLLDAGFLRTPYTWCNNRVGRSRRWVRLDRILINPEWMRNFSSCKVDQLTRAYSKHSPILLTFQVQPTPFPRPFRFQRIWTTHDNFFSTIKASWNDEITTTHMLKFVLKMKKLKTVLKSWNKEVFRDVNKNVQDAEKEVLKAEFTLLNSQTEEDTLKLNQAHANLKMAYLQEEIFWK